MEATYTAQEVLLAVRCGECGVWFGMTEFFHDKRNDDGKTWYCPNGHPRVYRETEAMRLKKQLESERVRSARLAANLDQTQASLSATKGQVTRLKNRAKAGVCPCCNRTFQQLSRHMATKHPDFSPDA